MSRRTFECVVAVACVTSCAEKLTEPAQTAVDAPAADAPRLDEPRPDEPQPDEPAPGAAETGVPTPVEPTATPPAPPLGATGETPCQRGPAPPFDEPGGPRAFFSVHGYLAYDLRIERKIGEELYVHCLRLGWPSGALNNEGQPTDVARTIGPSWFRAIENTLARVPWHHVQTLRSIIIDNRPKEHGIAPYDRQSADDARDGHTMWLHEHLFRDPNHWTQGNHGSYWSYHVNEDKKSFASQPAEHDLFSPVLLHELGHLVMYNVVNGGSAMPSTPACALTCGDTGTCSHVTQLEREAGCISPYCMPFRFPAGTENFAEQYRFHYQSPATRDLLTRFKAGCTELLMGQDQVGAEPHPAPWEQGLPGSSYRPSLWKSCQGRACKGF